MRNPNDWKKSLGAFVPAVFWAGVALTRGDAQQTAVWWATAGIFLAFAIYYLVRPAKPPDAP
jgi:hypothetical protein